MLNDAEATFYQCFFDNNIIEKDEFNPILKFSTQEKQQLKDHYGVLLSFENVGIFYDDEGLRWVVFTSNDTFENWKYFAGFQYIPIGKFNIIQLNGKSFTFIDEDEDDRIAELFNIISEEPEID